jgi:hypothetical protein
VQQHHGFALTILDAVYLAPAKQQHDGESDGIDEPESDSFNNALYFLFTVAIRVSHVLHHGVKHVLRSNCVFS